MRKKMRYRLKRNIIWILIIAASFIMLRSSDHNEKNIESHTTDEIIVLFEKAMIEENIHELLSPYKNEVVIERHIDDYALIKVYNSSIFTELMTYLNDQPEVQLAQENIRISTLGFTNDTYIDTQWAIDNTGSYTYITDTGERKKKSVEGIDLDVVEAWKLLKKSKKPKREVVVAIIDTGIDFTHPDLAENMWINRGEIDGDGIDNDHNGYIDDVYGWDFYNDDASVCHYKYSEKYDGYLADPMDNDNHGTHVAGIIAAVVDNDIGIAGVASNIDIKVMALKINGGDNGSGNMSSAIEAVKYATMMGADICNLSWGTTQKANALEKVMRESDMLFIAAAGNTGDNNNEIPIYPANFDMNNLISVTFINSSGELTGLSNYGSKTVDIAAPGQDIYSTIVGSYATMTGSSMAAPHVSAIAAMLYACEENIYPSGVRKLMINSLKPLPKLDGEVKYAGIPSAYQVLSESGTLPRDEGSPVMSFTTQYSKDRMDVRINVEDAGGSGLRVVKWSYGEKNVEDFYRGTVGSGVEKSTISVAKAGVYTFYASDYAGNETVQTYLVDQDKTPPKIKASYTVAGNYKSRTVTVKVTDDQSGIKRVKYMSGTRKAEEFLPAGAGTLLVLKNGKASFQIKKDGTYTLFAIDNRGNMTTKLIKVETVKAYNLKLGRVSKSLKVGDLYQLRTYIKPTNTTDKITFASSNKKIATVDENGMVSALAPGKATITAKTSSGIKATCVITIEEIVKEAIKEEEQTDSQTNSSDDTVTPAPKE